MLIDDPRPAVLMIDVEEVAARLAGDVGADIIVAVAVEVAHDREAGVVGGEAVVDDEVVIRVEEPGGAGEDADFVAVGERCRRSCRPRECR